MASFLKNILKPISKPVEAIGKPITGWMLRNPKTFKNIVYAGAGTAATMGIAGAAGGGGATGGSVGATDAGGSLPQIGETAAGLSTLDKIRIGSAALQGLGGGQSAGYDSPSQPPPEPQVSAPVPQAPGRIMHRPSDLLGETFGSGPGGGRAYEYAAQDDPDFWMDLR